MKAWLAVLMSFALGALAGAQETEWQFNAAFKSGFLLSNPSPGASAETTAEAASLWRLRLEPEFWAWGWLKGGLAYEQRLRQASSGGLAAEVLPDSGLGAHPMLRLANGEGEIGAGPGLFWRQELDRLWLSAEGGWGQMVLGRQGVGWGHGVIFSPMDLVAPFNPLDADREWRRGVDALRLNLDLGHDFFAEGLGALGQDAQHSSFMGRLRKGYDLIDFEILGGTHFTDEVYGGALSAPLGKAEFHAEAVLHHLQDHWNGAAPWLSPHLVTRGMLGLSYSFNLEGRSLYAAWEYLDNGFGVSRAQELPSRLLDPQFAERLERGQLPVMARQAGALTLNYEWGLEKSLSLLYLFDFYDASGIFSPGIQWSLGDNLSLLAQAYLPYGRGREAGVQYSHYGSSPVSAFFQLKYYR